MPGDLFEQAIACCVQVLGARPGTGFHVAPRILVTCAHVISSQETGALVELRRWRHDRVESSVGKVLALDPETDVAVIETEAANPAFAPLGEPASIGDNLVGIGYPQRAGRLEQDQFTAVYEGQTRYLLLQGRGADRRHEGRTSSEEKFKGGQVEPGFSGGPLFNLVTGEVIGMTNATRDRSQALGGWAIGAGVLREQLAKAGVMLIAPADWPRPQTRAFQETRHRDSSAPPFQAPPLPRHYVSRPAIETALVSQLLECEQRPGVLPIFSMHGGGGAGKSTLAAAISHHPHIRDRFPDGLLWTELGQNPDIAPKLNVWAQLIAGQGANDLSEEACIGLLRTALYEKAILIIVDNVWKAEHLSLLLVGGPRCAVLYTTRRAEIADQVGAMSEPVGDLDLTQALELIHRRMQGQPLEKTETERLSRLMPKVGQIALAIELIGGLLNRGLKIAEVENYLAAPNSAGGQSSSARQALERCITLSTAYLRSQNPRVWERFIWLGLTPEGASLTRASCAAIWGVTPQEAELTLWRLADDALLSRADDAFRMHDLLREVALASLAAASPEGLGAEVAASHAQIVHRYGALAPNGRWDLLLDDGYVHGFLFWHVRQAGDATLARNILLATDDQDRFCWFVAREKLAQRAGYAADVRCCIALFAEQPAGWAGYQLLGALIIASLRSSLAHVTPEQMESLVAHGAWSALASFFSITQYDLDASLDDHAFRLRIGFVRGLDKRKAQDKASVAMAARLRAHAVENCLQSLGPPSLSVHKLRRWSQLLPLLPETDAKRLAREVMSACETVDDKVSFIESVPEDIRSAYIPVICDEIENLVSHERRIRLMSLVLRFVDPAQRAARATQLRNWVDALVAHADSAPKDRSGREPASGQPASSRSPASSGANLPAPGGEDDEVDQARETNDLEISGAFMRDLATAFYYIPLNLLTDIDRALTLCTMAYDARWLLGRLRNLVAAGVTPKPQDDPQARLDRATASGDYASAVDIIGRTSAGPADDFIALIEKSSSWFADEIAAAWLPYWRDLDPDGQVRSARALQARYPECAAGLAMLLVSMESDAADYDRLLNLLDRTSGRQRDFAMQACLGLDNPVITDLVLRRMMVIADAEEQTSAVVALMPYLPRDFPPELLDRWQNEAVVGVRGAAMVAIMNDLIHALSSGALADILDSSAKRESEWWVVEALTSTLRRISDVEEFDAVVVASRHIKAFDLRARLLGRTARRAADFGHFERAFSALTAIAPSAARWDETVELAQHLAVMGASTQAEAAAAGIASSSERSRAFALIAVEFAAQGLWNDARRLADEGVCDRVWSEWLNRILANHGVMFDTATGATTDARRRRRDPTFHDLQDAMTAIQTSLGEVTALTALAMPARGGDLTALRSELSNLWKRPIKDGLLLGEILAAYSRPELLGKIVKLAPLIAIGSPDDAMQTIDAVGKCARCWA